MKKIEIIAFDADDTLWVNEPLFQEVEKKFSNLSCFQRWRTQLELVFQHIDYV